MSLKHVLAMVAAPTLVGCPSNGSELGEDSGAGAEALALYDKVCAPEELKTIDPRVKRVLDGIHDELESSVAELVATAHLSEEVEDVSRNFYKDGDAHIDGYPLTGALYIKGSLVNASCFGDRIFETKVTNASERDDDPYAGSLVVSSNTGETLQVSWISEVGAKGSSKPYEPAIVAFSDGGPSWGQMEPEAAALKIPVLNDVLDELFISIEELAASSAEDTATSSEED